MCNIIYIFLLNKTYFDTLSGLQVHVLKLQAVLRSLHTWDKVC